MVSARSVRRVLVGARLQWGKGSASLFEIANARHHVDYWFCGKAGNSSRTDVVDAALKPGREHVF